MEEPGKLVIKLNPNIFISLILILGTPIGFLVFGIGPLVYPNIYWGRVDNLFPEINLLFILIGIATAILMSFVFRPIKLTIDRDKSKFTLSRVGIFGITPKEYSIASLKGVDLRAAYGLGWLLAYDIRFFIEGGKKIIITPGPNWSWKQRTIGKRISDFLNIPFDDRGYFVFKGISSSEISEMSGRSDFSARKTNWKLVIFLIAIPVICLALIVWLYPLREVMNLK